MTCSFELKIADFVLAINAVKHAAAAKDVRYYLNGIRVEVNDVHATFIATDGNRLATVKTFLVSPTPVPEAFSFTFDTDKIPQLLSWLKCMVYKGSKRTVVIEYEKRSIDGYPHADPNRPGEVIDNAIPGELCMTSDGERAFHFARPHDEKFPDWRRVMANPDAFKNPTNDGAFNGEYLADVAKVAKLFNPKYNGIKIKLDTGLALFECQNAEGVEFRETLMGMRI